MSRDSPAGEMGLIARGRSRDWRALTLLAWSDAGQATFRGRLRADDARLKMEKWRRYYNEDRPHGAIGNKRPIALQLLDGVASPSS